MWVRSGRLLMLLMLMMLILVMIAWLVSSTVGSAHTGGLSAGICVWVLMGVG